MDLDEERLQIISEEIRKAGEYAFRMQRSVHRSFKADGSVLTETDLAISHRITSLIHELFPHALVISEEEEAKGQIDAEWTFVLDPIDGTDVYSQGMPAFAVSLGILDSNKEPVGAFIAAPRFGVGEESLFVSLLPGKDVLINGEEPVLIGDKDRVSQITTGSKAYRYLDFSAYTGKIRILGSTILHILAPVLFPSVEASALLPCFIWDTASSHAVVRKLGMDLVYYDGSPYRYDDRMLQKKPFIGSVYSGTGIGREYLRKALPPRPSLLGRIS